MSNRLKLISSPSEDAKIFKGDIFIVPNKASIPGKFKGNYQDINNRFDIYDEKELEKEIEFYGKETIDYCLDKNLPTYKAMAVRDTLISYGKEYLEENQVEVWATGGENGENWGDHGMAKDELRNFQFGTRASGHFPSFFPESFFKNKKEGDTIFLQIEDTNIVFELKLNQNDYRYSRFGNFENVLEFVTA